MDTLKFDIHRPVSPGQFTLDKFGPRPIPCVKQSKRDKLLELWKAETGKTVIPMQKPIIDSDEWNLRILQDYWGSGD